MSTMGERIKELIEKKGLNQKVLAETVGCTEAAISHYIKGDRVPRSSVLTKIAIALDLKDICLSLFDYNLSDSECLKIGHLKKLFSVDFRLCV